MSTLEQATRRIDEADDILIVCHVSPDGDAIGSLLGLGLALIRKGAHVTMVCADPVPVSCRHLPHWESIGLPAEGTHPPVDLVVSLDCSDLARLGRAYDAQALSGVPIVNIDHHPTNVNFGTVNWVDPSAAATAQMLVWLIEAIRVPLDRDIATCLLNGIVTDTLGFRTPNTNADVLETTIKLIRAGVSLSDLTDQIFNHRPLETIRMWSVVLQNICLEGRILWSEITQRMRQQIGYEENGDAGLVNFMNTANEADITVIFDEQRDGRVNVSMRATTRYDVSQVALELGGGGHAQAAGCTLPGPIDEARSRVLSMLHQTWDVQSACPAE
jgi:phosphoesterase RecJ-like protein